MAILLTGASGFIGRSVLKLLIARGESVIVFGRKHPFSANEKCEVDWISGDLALGEGLQSIPWNRVTAVIHLAAAGVKAASRKWPDALAVNVLGTQRLLNIIRSLKITPKLFIARTFYEKFTDDSPILLENPYIATKVVASELVRSFSESYGGHVVFGTFYQVYGPGDDPGNVLSYAASEFKAGRQPVFGSGRGLRDWIYITDAAKAVVASLAIERSNSIEVDIGSGELRSIRDMVKLLHSLCDGAPEPIFVSSKDRADVNLVAKAISPVDGWRPCATSYFGLTQLLKSL